MKTLKDLKAERSQFITRMEEITGQDMTDKLRSEWDGLNEKVEGLSKDIERLEKQEELNKRMVNSNTVEEKEESKSLGAQFRDFLIDAVERGGTSKFSLRADPILSSTTTAVINKEVNNSVDILVSPGEAFLRELGVTFYPGLVGNFVIPAMAEDLATFPGEDASAASADMTPEALTLAARRLTHFQGVTRETLAQTNPAIYNGIVQNLVNGFWKAVANDLFDTLEADAATQIGGFGGGPVVYRDLVNMEASIGGLSVNTPAYVTTPAVKAYLKQTVESTYGKNIWMDEEINGYKAYGVPAANTDKIYFGDWSRTAVGSWGNLEIIVDPYTKAKQGEIVLTIVGLVDTGCFNKRAFAIMTDASVV